MGLYFAFSDESGDYRLNGDQNFITKNPYYVRATLLMQASEWKVLNNEFVKNKQKFDLPLEQEIKWAYLWTLLTYQKNSKPIPMDKPFYFLKDKKYSQLIDFVDSSLELLSDLSYVSIIITLTSNKNCPRITKENYILGWHLQELMQRIEMELQSNDENLCVLFVDPVSKEKNKLFREIYFNLYQHGDFIQRYSHIKDSLNIEYSHHSVGIQLADFIAGSFSGFLKGYANSKDIFTDRIKPYLPTRYDGDILGFGIREVPSDNRLRNYIRDKLNP